MSIGIEEWAASSDDERRRRALAIGSSLGLPPSAVSVLAPRPGARPVALFDVGGSRFALVPGGSARLGLDAQAFRASAAQLDSYASSAKEYGLPADIRAHVASVVTPPRLRDVPALLVEVEAWEIGLEPMSADDPEVAEVLRRFPGDVEVSGRFRVKRRPTGPIAWRIAPVSRGELTARLAESGARLLTSDEWEWACGAGATTLFRWGDDCPCNRYPVDAIAGDVHRAPGAFGLHVAEDPYRWEVVAEEGLRRGGDGGETVCGGAGFFLGWLPLATSYLDRPAAAFEERTPEGAPSLTGCFVRRALPVL
jgi:hypothetical protein